MQFVAFLLRVRVDLPELVVNDPEALGMYENSPIYFCIM